MFVTYNSRWVFLFLGIQVSICNSENKNSYLDARNKLLKADRSVETGGNIVLTIDEQKVNAMLASFQQKEIARGMEVSAYPPQMHFFHAKKLIDQSEVFKVIKAMPKGAILHIHEMSMIDASWLVSNATYLPNCYMCIKQGALLFHFFEKPPTTSDCTWELVATKRKDAKDVKQFDEMLYGNMTLVVDDPDKAYPTQEVVWNQFYAVFNAIAGLFCYAPVFKAYMYEALVQLRQDNIQYVEVRTLLTEVYELNGTIHDKRWIVEAYQDVAKRFVQNHPDSMGFKIIFSPIRNQNKTMIKAAVEEAIQLKKAFPDFLAGFDLVGREDAGHPLLYFVDELLYPSQQSPPADLPYFFHAGETDWEGEDVDKNLMDAILLNTSRIGHGFAITKHPAAMKLARQRGIAVEVNPISNQVLGLVSDLRNHPASALLATDFPVVISSDDPGVWGAEGVSYDFYEAFMGLAEAKGDLALLKKLCMNSIQYSAFTSTERSKAMQVWQKKWEVFIQSTVQLHGL